MSDDANPAVKYVAEIHGAREVTLVAAADLAYWKDRLQGEGLFPHDNNGRAELLLSAVALKWMGIKFNELSLSVMASHREDGSSRDGYYLIRAFNTSRLFSFCERVLFHTPYHRAGADVRAESPFSFRLTDGAETVLHAERLETTPARDEREDVWEGPIFLPGKTAATPGKQFFARLGGRTAIYPFSSRDVLKVRPSGRHAVFQWLLHSHLAGVEWRVRGHATHARSKTYNRAH
jgi:hypothetical protein